VNSTLRAERSLRQRLVRGLGATSLQPMVTATIQIVSLPLLLHAWGAAKYGDWLILSAVPSWLALSDIGLGAASGSEMTMQVAAGDREGALRTFQSCWIFVTGISLAILAIVSGAVWWFPWFSWLKLSHVSGKEAAEIICVLAAYVVLSQQNGVIESGFRCDGHFAEGTFWISILRLFETACATTVALFGGSLLAVAFTYLISRAIGTIAYMSLLIRLSSWIHLGFQSASWTVLKRMVAPALGFVAFPIGYALSFQGFTILVGARLGPVAVVMFTTVRTLSRLCLQLVNILKYVTWPELSRAFGSGDLSLARKLHSYTWQASFALSVLAGTTMWIGGPVIYRVWIHHGVAFDAQCFHILLFAMIANCLWEMSSVISMSMNGHCSIALTYTVITSTSLGLASLLLVRFGIAGAGMAILVGDLCMAVIVVLKALALLKDTPKRFFSSIFSVPDLRRLKEVTQP
jgi:O-antigen/teichoic acid export membrane protein